MMIFLSEHDVRRLSPEFRAELLRLMFEKAQQPDQLPDQLSMGDTEFEWDSFEAAYAPEPDQPKDSKQVIDITAAQARSLIANISDKSLTTLHLFAQGQPVALDQLLGTGKPYKDQTDLKRSFIGAVTRRLRTVTHNKNAALFLRSAITKDGQADAVAAISVRQSTTNALRVALGYADPITFIE